MNLLCQNVLILQQKIFVGKFLQEKVNCVLCVPVKKLVYFYNIFLNIFELSSEVRLHYRKDIF